MPDNPLARVPSPAGPAFLGRSPSEKATLSLVFGILGAALTWLGIGIVLDLAAIILGVMARRAAKTGPDGRSVMLPATGGILIGILGCAWWTFLYVPAIWTGEGWPFALA